MGRPPSFSSTILAALIAERLGPHELVRDFIEIDRERHAELQLDVEVERVLDEVVSNLSFDYAAIWLKDEQRAELRLERSRNVPGGKVGPSGGVDPEQSYLRQAMETGKTVVSQVSQEGTSGYPQRRTYRIFVPLNSIDHVIGVMEAGGTWATKEDLTAKERYQKLEDLARSGNTIGQLRPRIALPNT